MSAISIESEARRLAVAGMPGSSNTHRIFPEHFQPDGNKRRKASMPMPELSTTTWVLNRIGACEAVDGKLHETFPTIRRQLNSNNEEGKALLPLHRPCPGREENVHGTFFLITRIAENIHLIFLASKLGFS